MRRMAASRSGVTAAPTCSCRSEMGRRLAGFGRHRYLMLALGSVVSLWRYPVKSMMGEELTAAEVTERGLLGDRAYALVDSSDGKVASAKNPRKWPRLFDFRATFIEPPSAAAKVPPVRITLPDGIIITSQQSNLNQILSKALGREVTLYSAERGHVRPA